MLSSKNLDIGISIDQKLFAIIIYTKLIGDKYTQLMKKSIGIGAFAQVFEGYVKGNAKDKVAIKVLQNMPKSSISETIEKVRELYKREREIHATINSDHVVKLIDVVVCENTTNLILEFCEEGNLNKLLNDQIKRQLSQERAYQIFCQIVEGYKSLYNLKTLHRDLKPENILFSKGVAKIADFGFAKIIEEMDLAVDQTVVGTLLYSQFIFYV